MAKDPYRYFRVEARELIEGLTEELRLLMDGPPPVEALARMLRLAHTLKGAARVVKQPGIADVAHALETILIPLREPGQQLAEPQERELWRLLEQGMTLLGALEAPVTARDAATSNAAGTLPSAPVTASVVATPSDAAVAKAAARPSASPMASAVGMPSAAAAPSSAGTEEPLRTLRVEVRELDALLRGTVELGIQLGALRKALAEADDLLALAARVGEPLAGLDEAHAPPGLLRAQASAEALQSGLARHRRVLERGVDRAESGLEEVRELAHALRLVPARTLFPSLELAVRDAAGALEKRVGFEASGGEVRLDATSLLALRDALSHVVRNAVTHGLEQAPAREAVGKPAAGTVRLSVVRRQDQVVFLCQDDGQGIDLEAVRRAAVARGGLTGAAASALSSEALIELLLRGGLSTSSQLTELSGRGIGLDMVRATATRLKGTLRVETQRGQGTTVELRVPAAIAALQGLEVEAAGSTVAIPLEAVAEVVRIEDAALRRVNGQAVLGHEGQEIPFVPLERALRMGRGAPRAGWTAVVVRANGRRAAVGVNRVLGTATVVVRPIPGVAMADPLVAGAALDPDGNPRLVLEPAVLVERAERDRGDTAPVPVPRPAPILVIDDSVTTRMLEQSILESAGYQVELAVNAEEGLSKARAGRYSLYLVDVEMPGMNGFEFVSATRADPVLRDTPAILVTSLDGAEDRARGLKAGARAYIVKGELDQGELLRILRSLIG